MKEFVTINYADGREACIRIKDIQAIENADDASNLFTYEYGIIRITEECYNRLMIMLTDDEPEEKKTEIEKIKLAYEVNELNGLFETTKNYYADGNLISEKVFMALKHYQGE